MAKPQKKLQSRKANVPTVRSAGAAISNNLDASGSVVSLVSEGSLEQMDRSTTDVKPVGLDGTRPSHVAIKDSGKQFIPDPLADPAKEPRPGGCRHITGDVKRGDWAYCPNQAVKGTSWCKEHYELVHIPPEKVWDDDSRRKVIDKRRRLGLLPDKPRRKRRKPQKTKTERASKCVEDVS